MTGFPATVVLLVLINRISGYSLEDDSKELIYPSEYYYRGESIDMVTQLVKTYEVWYSASLNRSRISYYENTDTTYYYSDTGHNYHVHPITSSDLKIEIACFSSNSTGEKPDFLLDDSISVYTGTEQLNDKEVDVWRREGANAFLKRVTTMYTYRNYNGENVPVRYEDKLSNTDNGATIRHVIKNYLYFEFTVNDEDLTYENVQNCTRLSANFKKNIHILRPDIPEHLDIAFHGYINHHSRKYNEEEHQLRKRIFQKNWRMVQEENSKNVSYKLALNKFSDRTEEELSYLTGAFPSDSSKTEATTFPHTLEETNQLAEELPETFDLRIEGYISKVKNQGSCGSCWAFSVTAAVEGLLARSNGGQLYDLSEQSLVDCAWGYDGLGCRGGLTADTLQYVVDHGIATEEEYGNYLETNGYCRIGNMSKTFSIRGFTAVTPLHPNALKLALYKYGPVVVQIHTSDMLKHYSSGVFYDVNCEGHVADHAVTVVGYGVRDGDEYWIVKNTWGETWGEDGYILMANKNNNCFILEAPYYPYL